LWSLPDDVACRSAAGSGAIESFRNLKHHTPSPYCVDRFVKDIAK